MKWESKCRCLRYEQIIIVIVHWSHSNNNNNNGASSQPPCTIPALLYPVHCPKSAQKRKRQIKICNEILCADISKNCFLTFV